MEITLQDIKSILLALLVLILAESCKRFWQHRTKLSTRRKIESLEAEILWLERVGNSFEEAVLFSFRVLFAILMLIGIASIARPYFMFISGNGGFMSFVEFTFWGFVVFASFIAITKIGKIRKFPEEKEKLQCKIDNLTKRLRKWEES
jgi:hypothetical protein